VKSMGKICESYLRCSSSIIQNRRGACVLRAASCARNTAIAAWLFFISAPEAFLCSLTINYWQLSVK